MNRIVLIQLSDIHIGSELFGTFVSHHSPWSSLNGHQLLLCEKLEIAIRQVRLADLRLTNQDCLRYVVSGDLTRLGSDNDFHLAYDYLLAEWPLRDLIGSQPTGLRIPRADLSSVPGNHDHWDGYRGGLRPPAYNPGVFPRFFQKTPWRRSIWCQGNTMALELFGVDSNEGLRGQTTHNLRARGVLSQNELDGLYQELVTSQKAEINDGLPRIRAIVCHHAFTNPGGAAQPLEQPSRMNLLSLAAQFRVAAILTGHTHTFESQDYQDVATGNVAWELRSASTTQVDPQPAPQGFWVHVIELNTAATPTWTAWKYQWDSTTAQFDRHSKFIPVR